jgi:DNA-binding CsgD family transcriptional regulator
MTGGTLLVSRANNLFPYWKKTLEQRGFQNVHVTSEEKDSLNMVINELKPRLVLVGSCFYKAATPYMMGVLRKYFPRLYIAAVNIHEFPDGLAPWFVWHGVNAYVNIQEGLDEFYFGLDEVRKGHTYISPTIKNLMEEIEWPEINDKAGKRQLEVLTFLCNGILLDEIAGNLHISRRTVDWHVEELFKTFDVQSREELISTAFCLEIITKDDLCFFNRKTKSKPLPKWAVIKQQTSRRRVV